MGEGRGEQRAGEQGAGGRGRGWPASGGALSNMYMIYLETTLVWPRKNDTAACLARMSMDDPSLGVQFNFDKMKMKP